MKKNIIIIALIFIVPIVAYMIMSETQTASATKHTAGMPQVVKFSSPLCIDCKKMKKVFEETTPKYKDKIEFVEYNVQSNEKEITDKISEHNINLVPTILYINKSGKEIRRTEGYVENKTFESYLNELLK